MNGTGNESKPTVHWTRYAVGVLATLAGLLLVWYFRDIVGYIIVSAVLAIIGTPLAKLMKRVRVRGRSVPDWLAALVVLLERGKCLKTYFSEFERREMQEKIDRISDTPKGRMVRKMVETIDGMMGAFVTSLMLLS